MDTMTSAKVNTGEKADRMLAWRIESVEADGSILIRVLNPEQQAHIADLMYRAEQSAKRVQELKEGSKKRYEAMVQSFGIETQLSEATAWFDDLARVFDPADIKAINREMTESTLKSAVYGMNCMRAAEVNAGQDGKPARRSVRVETTVTKKTVTVVQDDGNW